MLNLTGIFTTNSTANGITTSTTTNSTTNTGSAQPQPAAATAVEAQLWNADWVEPASPALPRYIPAIAGKGAGMGAGSPNLRMGGGGGGRLNAGWGSGGGSVGMGRKSGEGAGWKTAPATTTSSPSFDRRSSESVAQSFKSRVAAGAGAGAGYIPNSNTNGHSMLLQQQQQYQQQQCQQQQQPAVSPSLRRNQSLQQRNGGDGTETGAGGSLEMSWMNGGGGTGYDDNSHHHDQDDYDDGDYYKDRKKDRSYYTRRDNGYGRGQTSHFPLLFRDPRRVLRARLFCLRQNRRLHPCIRLVVFLFLAGSVCFTTIHLLFLGAGRPDGLGRPAELRKSFDLTEQQLRVRKMLGRSKVPQRVLSSFDVEAQNYSNHQWTVDTYDIKNSKSSSHSLFVSQGMLQYGGGNLTQIFLVLFSR